MEQESKITNLHYKIEGVEDNLEWKIEALQSGFADPREYSEWKCSEEYEAYGEEEKLRLEKQVADRKSWRPIFYHEDKVRKDFGLPVPTEGVATELPQPLEEAEDLANHSPSYSQEEGKSLNFSNPCKTLSLDLQEPKATEEKEGSMNNSIGADEKEDLTIKTEEEPSHATSLWPHDERTSLRPVSLRPHGRAPDPRPADPRPHGHAPSPRSPTGPARTSLGQQPHDAASSLRSPSPRPHGRAPTMRQTIVPDQPPDDPRTEEVTDQLPPTRDHVPRLRILSPHGQTLDPRPATDHDPPSQPSDHDRVPRSTGPSTREPNIDPREATGPDQQPETDSDCEPEPELHQTYDHDPPAPNQIEPGDVMDVRREEKHSSTSEDLDEDEEETNVVYSCTATKFPSNEVPEDEALKQLQRELHDQGTPRPRNPPPSRVARRLPPVPLQTHFQHPYPRANVYQQNQFEGSQVSFRLPQQVFHSQEIGISKQVKHMGQPENLFAQYLEYVKMIEKTTRERLDKMDSILCGKIDEISAFVKNFGEKHTRDVEEIDKRFRRIESEIGSCFIGGQDHAGRLEDSNKMTKAVGDRLDHFSIETVRKLTDVLSYIDLLQRRAISSECTIQKILVRQDNLEEAFLDESRKIIGSHDHTSAILRAARVLREEATRRANLPREESTEARQRAARRQDERTEEGEPNPHVGCNVVNAHPEPSNSQGPTSHREPHGISLLRNRWYPQWISLRDLGDFNRAVADLPPGTSFAEACLNYDIDRFFLESCETRKEIRELYEQALNYTRPFNTLRKLEPPGRFVVTCYIRGIEFRDALCDSGSCVNVMTSAMARQIGIKELRPSKIRIGLANSAFTTPEGLIEDMYVRIGNSNIPTDFHVIDTVEGMHSQLILGGPFLSTTGAVMDWTKGRMFFANINEDIFYEAKPLKRNRSHDDQERRPQRETRRGELADPGRERPEQTCHGTRSPSA